ncbi:MAG: ABC transporter permease [Acutalibacteraceae bacterium]|nr:ABC transporter permease [Acutalibacteraceae bacterium]
MIEEFLLYPVKNLFRKKGRSILTILGVAIGVCSVIIISSIGSFGTIAVNTELDSLGLGGLTVAVKNGNVPLGTDELNTVKYTSGIKSATPVFMESSEVLSSFGKSENSVVWGIDSNTKDIVSLQLLYGREINKKDIAENSPVCMVDQTFAQKMYGKDNAVGHKITLALQGNTQIFTITGVIKTGSGLLQSAMGNYVPNFVYIPYTTMQSLTGYTNYNQIIIKATDDANLTTLAEAVKRRLTMLNGEDSDSYTVNNLAKQRESLTNILNIVTSILSAVGAVSLVVAGLSIMTVMLVSVGERKREIGIKKAIGATKFIIVREFLGEALMLSILGCVTGTAIALGIVYLGSVLLNISINIDTSIILITCGFSIISGVVFGVYPALKAAKLKPAETLRAL